MNFEGLHLGDRALLLFGALQVVGSLGLLVPAAWILYAAGMVALLAALLADLRSLASATVSDGNLSLSSDPELGVPNRLAIKVVSTADDAAVDVVLPDLKTFTFGERVVTLPAEPSGRDAGPEGGTFGRSVPCRAVRLGYEEVNEVRLLVRSRRRLWLRRTRVAIPPFAFRVSPRLVKLPPAEFTRLLLEQGAFREGVRRLSRHRSADQFLTVREYRHPDPMSRIDPRKSAKFDRLMTRDYEAYRNVHLVIALDLGRPMCGGFSGSSKHDYYLSAALNLVRDALRHRDSVSFVAFAREVHHVVSGKRNLAAFADLYRGSRSLAPREVESNYAILAPAVARVATQRSIVVLFTDLSRPSVQEALLDSALPLYRRHFTAVVTLADEKVRLVNALSAASGAALTTESYASLLYAYWLDERLALFRESLARAGGRSVAVPERYWMSATERIYDTLRSSLSAG